jgi:hypothetical protein
MLVPASFKSKTVLKFAFCSMVNSTKDAKINSYVFIVYLVKLGIDNKKPCIAGSLL